MFLNTSFYPIITFPKKPHTKILFSYHQYHNTKISLNETSLPLPAQKFESVPVCVGSNNCYNSKNVFIFKIVLYPFRCKLLGCSFGWNVCVYMEYMNEK